MVGNGNIETHYAAIHNDGTTLTAPTINYLNDQLELRDKRIRELEAKNVDLERMMTALSETVGDFKCTSVDNNSRFSCMTCLTMPGFSLNEGLNFGGQGRHGGDEEVGDEEEDSGNGDQKQNARKRKHAPEGQEGKQDNEEEEENGNGDEKPKARKKMLEKVIRLLMTTVVRFHIIDIIFNLQEEATLQEEAKDVLMEHTQDSQDSSIQMSSAIQMPSSNALQVVQIWVIVTTSCGVNQVKSINISTLLRV